MSLSENSKIEIVKSFAGIVSANASLQSVGNTDFIQKRGFTYTGDSANGWGLRNSNVSWNWGNDFILGGVGRGGNGFSLQPFGFGINNLTNGLGITPSIFSQSGSGSTYSRHTRLAHTKIALSVEAYKGFGVVKNVIDLMCNFASEGLKIIHPRPKVQKFYERWAESVDLQGRAKDAIREYYKTANVFIYTTMGTVDEASYNKMRSIKGSSDSDIKDSNDPDNPLYDEFVNKERKKPIGKRKIPWRYTLLNPLQMDVRGTKYFGGQEWVFVLDEETRNKTKDLKSTTNIDFLDDTEVNLPPEFKKRDEGGGIIKLDQARLYTLHYMKSDHEDWADPMVWPVMNDIMYKNQLRAMDMSVANSVINAITIFKLGDIKSGYTPPPSHFAKLAEMLRTPTYSHTLVWNDAIQMESNYPPIEKLLSIDKYRSVDRDILAGLGVPAILVDGAEGGNFSNAFLQVRTMLERLEEGRNEIMKWINKQLRLIARVMGHRDIPTVKFGHMSLRDEEAEKKLIIQLMDRNIISAERVHEFFDIETDIEIERMKKEKELSDRDGIMTKFGPFKDPMNMMDAEDTMKLDFKLKKDLNKSKPPTGGPGSFAPPQGKNVVKPNGRPPGSTGPQEKRREVKPKGMGELSTKASSMYDEVSKYIADKFVLLRKVRSKKYLTSQDRKSVEELTFATMLGLDPYDNISTINIEHAMSNIDMDARDKEILTKIMSLADIKTRKTQTVIYYIDRLD